MNNFLKLLLLGIVISSISAVMYVANVSAFVGPTSNPSSANGAIGVNGSYNVSFGTSTPSASAKVLIVSSSTNSGETALQIIQPGGSTILILRNDGTMGIGTSTNSANVTVAGTLGFATGGSFTGSVSANNVTANTFASGFFSFPSSLGVNTSTNASLPANLSIYGTSLLTQTSTLSGNLFAGGNVNVTGTLDVNGTDIWANAISASSTVTIGAALNQSGAAVSLASTTVNGNATTTRLTISGLGSSGSPCLNVSATGVVATTTCGGGLSGGQANYFGLWTGASTLATTTLQQNGTTTWVSNGFAVGTSTIQPTGNLYATGAITSNGHANTGNVTTTNLTISGLGSSGTPCLSVSATGVVATTTCGGGALSGGQANYFAVWSSSSAITTTTLQQNGTTTYTTQGFAVGTSSIQAAGNIYVTGQYLNGTIGAAQVTAGTFGAGNSAFPAKLGVGTSSGASLPDNFDVYGEASILGTSSASTFNVQASGTTVFSVDTVTSTLFLLEVQNSSGADLFTITTSSVTSVNGHLSSSSTVPSNSACGSVAPTIAGNDFAGVVTISSTATSSCRINFATTFKVNPPVCVATGITTSSITISATSTLTTLTIQTTPANSSTFNHFGFSYICIGRNE